MKFGQNYLKLWKFQHLVKYSLRPIIQSHEYGEANED